MRRTTVGRPVSVILLAAAIALVLVVPSRAEAGHWSTAATIDRGEATSGATIESAPAATPVRASSASGWTRTDIRRQVQRRTNQVRHRLNRSSLRRDGCLDRAAQRWAGYLARNDQFRHQNLRPVLRDCDMRLVTENLALGYKQGYAAVRGWLNSPGHRSNLLHRQVRKAGIGAAKGPRGWVVVQVLGRPA